MLVKGKLSKLMCVVLAVTIFSSLLPAPVWAEMLNANTVIYSANASVNSSLTGNKDIFDANILEKLPSDLSEHLPNTNSVHSPGDPNGLLLDVGLLQTPLEQLDSKSNALISPLSISKLQSTYVPDTISNTLLVTYTVRNNLAPANPLPLDKNDTFSETLDILLTSTDYSNDPNVIRNVLMTEVLDTGQSSLIESSHSVDRQGNVLAWSLGDIPPMDSITVSLKITLPSTVLDITPLSEGASVWGTNQGNAVHFKTRPIQLVPLVNEQWLVCTVDANCYDEFVIEQATQLGNDPGAIFNYVRDLDFESYQGSLRGSRGTLWSQAGNSMDQASLLIAMLRASGVPAAYRYGTLDDNRAKELILSMFPDPISLAGHIPQDTVLADPENDLQLLIETREHWWVEANLPELGWTQLDPSFYHAQIGDTFTSFIGDRLVEVPNNSRHKVTLKLRVEEYHPLNVGSQNLGLSTHYPLEHTLNAVELVGEPVSLGHLVNSTSNGGAIFYYTQHSYTPYFSLNDGDTIIEGSTFEELVSNFPLGTFQVSGEWVEIELIDPDGNVENYEREILDKIGFEARQEGGTSTLTLDQSTDPSFNGIDTHAIYISTSQIPMNYVHLRMAKLNEMLPEMETYRQQLQKVGEGNEAAELLTSKDTINALVKANQISVAYLSELFYSGSGYLKTVIPNPYLVKTYESSPQILIASIETTSTVSDTVTTEIGIDLLNVKNRVLAFPQQAKYVELVAQSRWGMLDTVLESQLIQRLTGKSANSAAQVFSTARVQELELKAITSLNLDDLVGLAISEEAKARITSAVVEDNKTVIVPTEMVEIHNKETIAWYEIDVDGYTIGVGEDGRHVGFGEIASIMSKVSTKGRLVGFLGGAVVSFFGYALGSNFFFNAIADFANDVYSIFAPKLESVILFVTEVFGWDGFGESISELFFYADQAIEAAAYVSGVIIALSFTIILCGGSVIFSPIPRITVPAISFNAPTCIGAAIGTGLMAWTNWPSFVKAQFAPSTQDSRLPVIVYFANETIKYREEVTRYDWQIYKNGGNRPINTVHGSLNHSETFDEQSMAGEYTIVLQAYNGTEVVSSAEQQVTIRKNPEAHIIGPIDIPINVPVVYRDASIGDVDSWTWRINGSVVYNGPNFSMVLREPGQNLNISLTVSGRYGSDEISISARTIDDLPIEIHPTPVPPGFTPTPLPPAITPPPGVSEILPEPVGTPSPEEILSKETSPFVEVVGNSKSNQTSKILRPINQIPITTTTNLPDPKFLSPYLTDSLADDIVPSSSASTIYQGGRELPSGVLQVDLETGSTHLNGEIEANWQSNAEANIQYVLMSIPDATIRQLDGTLLDTGQLRVWNISSPGTVMLNGLIDYDLDFGRANLSSYASALPGIGVSANWSNYHMTATVGAPISTIITPEYLEIDGTAYESGEYIVEFDEKVYFWADNSRLFLIPFAPQLTGNLTDANLSLGAAIGFANIDGYSLNIDNGLNFSGFSGPITITEHTTNTDRIQLAGNIDQLIEVSVAPAVNTIVPLETTQFQIDVLSNISDTYHLKVIGPAGWHVNLDRTGLATVRPAPGIGNVGDFTFTIKAESISSGLIVQTNHVITINPHQGLDLSIIKHSELSVPLSSNDEKIILLPDAAYTTNITNTSTISHVFDVGVSGLPTDWLILSGTEGSTDTSVTLPAGGVGQIGLYISPTLPLPVVGSSFPFDVTAIATDNPALTQTDTAVFTMPAVPFNYVTTDPSLVYVSPDTEASFDLSVENVGNVAGAFPITVTMPISTWTTSYANSRGNLTAGSSHTQTVSFTPVGATVGEDMVIQIDSPAPATVYTQSTFVNVAVRAPEVVCAFNALQVVPANDPGLIAATSNLLTQLEKWTEITHLGQRDTAVSALHTLTQELNTYPNLDVTAQLTAVANQISLHTDATDLATDRANLGTILCQELTPTLELLAQYQPRLQTWPTVLGTIPGRTVTSTITVANNGSVPTTAVFSLDGVPAGWNVTAPPDVTLQPGIAQQLSLPITPDALGTTTISVTMQFTEVPTLTLTQPLAIRGVPEMLTITSVELDPAFMNVGSGTTDVRMSLINQAALRTTATAEVQLTDAAGSTRQSFATPYNVAVNNNGSFNLGQFDISGLEEGVYTATVHLLDTNGSLIPNAVGYTHLTIGQDLHVTYDLSPSLITPGQPGITVTTAITTERSDILTSTVTFTPTLKWTYYPSDTHTQAMVMPAAGDINLDGIPDVVLPTYTGWYRDDGILRVISGDDGTPIFSVTDSALRVEPSSSPLIVDLDNDGSPEIIIERDGGGLYAFDNIGNLKYNSVPTYTLSNEYQMPTVADLDKDGFPEVIVGRHVLDHTLSTVTVLGNGDDSIPLHSIVGDVNLDGNLEVIDGNTIYAGSGGILHQNLTLPGYAPNALGNFDIDPYPEIVLVDYNGWGQIYLLDHEMNIVSGPLTIANGGRWNGGHPTVADFDGDGWPEIGVSGSLSYTVFDVDPTNGALSVLWTNSAFDGSGQTGSSVFDFQGDGQAEVVFSDEQTFRVFDGATGNVLFTTPNISATSYEYPIIVDIDADQHAEIVLVGNSNSSYTVRAFEAEDDSWVSTRQLWHQYAYDITSVDDNLQVVSEPVPPWLLYNSFRSQASTPNQGNSYFIEVDHGLSLMGTAVLSETITPIPIAFSSDQIQWTQVQQDRQQLKVGQLTQRLDPPLQPGEVRPVSTGTSIEYTLNNNTTAVSIPPLYVVAPKLIGIEPEEQVALGGETAVYTVTLTNPFTTTETITLETVGIPNAWVTMTDTVSLTPAEVVQLPLTVTVPIDADSLEMIILVRAFANGGEDAGSAILDIREGFELTLMPELQFVSHGDTVTYTVQLTNTANTTETYQFSAVGLDGLPIIFPGDGSLVPGQAISGHVEITALATEGALPFTIQATSNNGLSGRDEAGLGLWNGPAVEATLTPETGVAGPGTPVSFTLTTINTGSISETFEIDVALPAGWSYLLDANGTAVSELSLTPHVFNAADLLLLITPPLDATPGTVPFTVTAQSRSNPSVQGVTNGTVTVGDYGVVVSLTPESTTMAPTDTAVWSVTVTNTGSIADSYDLVAGGIAASSAQFSVNPVALAPGSAQTVQLSADELSFALPQTYPVSVIATSTADGRLQNGDTVDVTFTGFEATEVSWLPSSQTLTDTLTATYMVLITNTGNISTIYDLSLSVPGLEGSLETTEVYIPPHMTAGILATVTGSAAGTYQVTVNYSSESGLVTGSQSGTLIIEESAIPNPPTAVDDTAVTDEDTAVSIPVLSNDSDPDGDPLSVTAVTQPLSGTVGINGDNSVTYTPVTDFNGLDNFTYTVGDGTGLTDTAVVSVTVNSVVDAPIANPDNAVVDEDTAVTISILDNDHDPDGDPLTLTTLSTPANGVVIVNVDNSVTYTPTAEFNGGDSFTYTISDTTHLTDTATVSITITAVNDLPLAVDDFASTEIGVTITVTVLSNDSDVDGDSLSVISTTQPISGTAVLHGDNTISYTPTSAGTDSFSYTVDDGNGGQATATVTIAVNPPNRDPIGVDDNVSLNEDTAINVNVLVNDSDPDGDPLIVTAVTTPTNGTAVLNLDSTITYTPTADFNGSDSLVYTLADGAGGFATATMSITVLSVNDLPEIVAVGIATTDEDTPISIPVLDNVVDPDGDSLTVIAVAQPANGSVSINLDNSVTYTPTTNFNGNDSFGYTVSDGNGGQASGTISVTVESVNDLPEIIGAGLASTDEDLPVTISVLDNVIDADGDPLIVTMITQPLTGTAVLNPDYRVTYTPTLNFHGTDSFTYIVSDGNGGLVEGTILVTVNTVNDSPTILGVAMASTNEDTPVTVVVLDYVADVDGDPLTVLSVSTPLSGTAVINPDDSVTYTPTLNIQGTDSFSYTVADGNGGQVDGQVVITIAGINDAPVAVDDSEITLEDTAVTIDVLANDNDVDGDLLSVQSVTQPTNGQVIINPDETIQFTPDTNFNGSDNFSYIINDGNGGTDIATVAITVTAVNDAPVAIDDGVSTAEDNSVNISVLGNDQDVDGDLLTVQSVTQPANGVAIINLDETVTYTPDENFNGLESFNYTVSDGQGGIDTAVISVTVTAVNDIPIALNDLVSTNEDTSIDVIVLTNDSDADGDALTVTAVTTPTFGTATINIDNSVTYTPTANFNGGDAFDYTISDGNGGFDTAVISITVAALNDVPIAVDDNGTTNEDTAVILAVLDNDIDVDGDSLLVSATTQPINGVVTINADNSMTYTPTNNFNGSDSFTYTVADGNGGTDVATVSVTVSPINDLPEVVADTAVTDEDTTVIVDVLSNDGDVDGDSLSVTAVTTPTNGTAVRNPDETISYTPVADFNGNDSFNYTVADGQGGFASATVSVTVIAVNDLPIAVDDLVVTPEDTAVIIDVLANDSDVDGDALTVVSVTTPTNGMATIYLDGTVWYTPTNGYNGSDSLTYTIEDGQGGSAMATVQISVTSTNDNPVAVDDHATTAEDTPIAIPVLNNDSDVDGDPLTIVAVTPPFSGTAVISGNNITYTPDANTFGLDNFSYTIEDGQGGAATALVAVTVTAVNDAPIAADDMATTNEDTAVTIDVLANDDDIDNDALQVVEVGQTILGTTTINPDYSITYTPTANINGSATFSYTVSDGQGGTDIAFVDITVFPRNDNPVAMDDTAATNEDTAVIVDILANDNDVDGDALTVTVTLSPTLGTAQLNPDNSITFTPFGNQNGSDSLTYSVNDGLGGTDTAVVNLTILPVNDDPIAVDDLVTTLEDTAVNIDVLANDSDVDGDSLVVADIEQPTSGTAVLEFNNTVTYTPTLGFAGIDSFIYRINDGQSPNIEATVFISVTATNLPPVVNAGADIVVNEGEFVTLNGSFTDPDSNDTHSIEWIFTDGITVTDMLTPTRIFADDGVFSANLYVEDNYGAFDNDVLEITVQNVAPVVSLGEDLTSTEGVELTFNGVFTDPGTLDTHTIQWDLGDGTIMTDVLTISHTYLADGIYNVTLQVSDDDGGVGQDALVVTVNNANPVVFAGLDQAVALGTAVSFSGSFTDTGSLDTHTLLWEFGDGSTITNTLTPTHTYALTGTYTTTLTITDDDGGIGSDDVTITVHEAGPSSISGLIWEDSNGNGLQDVGEFGLEQVLVNLFKDDGDGIFEPAADDVLELSAITDLLGVYSFDNLAAGVYWVDPYEATLPTSYKANNILGLQLISISGGQVQSDVNFGYQPIDNAICVTLQRPAALAETVYDAVIASNLPDSNDGNGDRLYLGGDLSGEQQSLIQFDLSAIPSTAVIDAATYEMYMLTMGSELVRLHQVTMPWEETAVTWNSFNQAYMQQAEGYFTNNLTGTHAVDVTNLVQNWVNGSNANHGLLLEQNSGSVDHGKSSEYPIINTRPALHVCYHVADNTLPPPWISTDIGNVAITGTTHFANDMFTIQASGQQIWGNNDGFHYVYQPLTGDGIMTAYVDKPLAAGAWTFAGLMIRESLADDSRHMMLRVHHTGELWSAQRTNSGGSTSQWRFEERDTGQWVRLVRVGDTIFAYRSLDGLNWEFVDTTTFNNLSNEVYFGMAVTSYDNSQQTLAQFDDVTLTQTTSILPWLTADIGAVANMGTVFEENGDLTLYASGNQIWGTSDSFYYIYQPLSGDGVITAEVTAPLNTGDWAVAGLMLRESLDADARHVNVRMLHDNSIWTAARTTTGGSTSQVNSINGSSPYWLRLERVGNTITTYYSADGLSWIISDTQAMALSQDVYIGLAVTAYSSSEMTMGMFKNISLP